MLPRLPSIDARSETTSPFLLVCWLAANDPSGLGVPPNYVAKLVGHSIKTMERHYENIQLKNLQPELVEVRKKKLEQADFQTYDLELG